MSAGTNANDVLVYFEYGTTKFKRRWKLYNDIQHDLAALRVGHERPAMFPRGELKTVDDFFQISTSVPHRDLRSYLFRIDSLMRMLYASTMTQVFEGLGGATFDLEFRVMLVSTTSERAVLWQVFLDQVGDLQKEPALPEMRYLVINRMHEKDSTRWVVGPTGGVAAAEIIDVAYDHLAGFPLVAT